MTSNATLVVGSEGFVGARLVAALRRAGAVVVTASRRGAPADRRIDITDRNEARVVITDVRPATVIHLAAASSTDNGRGARDRHFRVNFEGFRNVYDAAVAAGCRRIILASSTSVYGRAASQPTNEADVPTPDTPYAESKLAAEQVCLDSASTALESVVYRFPPVYGAGWIRNLRVRVCVPGTRGFANVALVGHEPRYSLCAIDNAVDAIAHAVRGLVPPGVYVVADAVPYRHSEIRRVVQALDGTRITLPLPTAVLRMIASAANLIPSERSVAFTANLRKLAEGAVFDTSKLLRVGFVPQYSLADLLNSAAL